MRPYIIIKQVLDLLCSICLIMLLLPMLIIIAIIIKFESKGSVLFKQKRIGRNKIEFEIYKFRTMYTDAPKDLPTHLLNNAESFITRSGRILRKTSLDELPQLINILFGQMSFIGPRPALWNQYDLIEARDNQMITYGVNANSVKPGITGWAQINGRDELPINIKASFDGYYAKRISFLFDLEIVFKTVYTVLTGKGIIEGTNSENQTRGD